jgi:glucans biosynthesis protein C
MQSSNNRPPAGDRPRTEFIDHLRVLLTALVIFHHTAICYGSPGGWYYHEVPALGNDPATNFMLTMFAATNQAFFMGFFFLLAGYFIPASLAKKGYRSFLTDRFIRLGIPLLAYGFLISPLTVALAQAAQGKIFLNTLFAVLGQFHAGPLWFAEALLIFTVIYVLFCKLRTKYIGASGQDSRSATEPSSAREPSSVKDTSPTKDSGSCQDSPLGITSLPVRAALSIHAKLLFSALSIGAISLLIRQWYPPGKEFLWLQLGYFSSYTFLFYLGCLAWHHRWLEKIEERLALPWLAVSLAAIAVFGWTAVSSGWFSGARVDFSGGGLNINSVVYAFEEPLAAWGIILTLLWLFRLKFNDRTMLGHILAQRAYAIYIIHPPILVGVSLLLRSWHAPSLLKFPVVASLALCCCAVIAGLLLRIDGAKRIIG